VTRFFRAHVETSASPLHGSGARRSGDHRSNT